MKNLQKEITNEVVKYMKENKTTDYCEAFEAVMKKRLSFYDNFEKHLDENINRLDSELQKGI